MRRRLLAWRRLLEVSSVGDRVQNVVGVKALAEQVGRAFLRNGQTRIVIVKGCRRVVVVVNSGGVWPDGGIGAWTG